MKFPNGWLYPVLAIGLLAGFRPREPQFDPVAQCLGRLALLGASPHTLFSLGEHTYALSTPPRIRILRRAREDGIWSITEGRLPPRLPEQPYSFQVQGDTADSQFYVMLNPDGTILATYLRGGKVMPEGPLPQPIIPLEEPTQRADLLALISREVRALPDSLPERYRRDDNMRRFHAQMVQDWIAGNRVGPPPEQPIPKAPQFIRLARNVFEACDGLNAEVSPIVATARRDLRRVEAAREDDIRNRAPAAPGGGGGLPPDEELPPKPSDH